MIGDREGRRFLNSVVVLLGREVLFLASVGVNSVRLNMFCNTDLAAAKTRISHIMTYQRARSTELYFAPDCYSLLTRDCSKHAWLGSSRFLHLTLLA